jgi:8-amino-7-oxononanoate synthase
MSTISNTLEQLRISGNLRAIPTSGNGNGCIDLSSNDYLGLAAHPELQEEFLSEAENCKSPFTSSASRLLAAKQEDFFALEALISNLYSRSVLLFNSGYHANVGIVSALASEGTMILADKLVHASIIDGIVLSRAKFLRFAHNDLGALARLLEKHASSYERILVVVESVYSMDGDQCDIDKLIDLKEQYPNVMLYVDEAHAFGVLGTHGLGLVQSNPRRDSVDVIIGTLGKAAASSGAFVATTAEIREYLVNRARSFIFSTAIPPIVCRWSHFMIEKIITMDNEREALRQLTIETAKILSPYSTNEITPSHIMPMIIGDAARTVAISKRLLENGVKVLPIRTPTVPPDTERLRFRLSASLTTSDLQCLRSALASALSTI